MDYNVVSGNTLAEVIDRVNEYRRIGYHPIGGIAAIREAISGPVCYFQAIYNSSLHQEARVKRSRGRPRGTYRRHDNGVSNDR